MNATAWIALAAIAAGAGAFWLLLLRPTVRLAQRAARMHPPAAVGDAGPELEISAARHPTTEYLSASRRQAIAALAAETARKDFAHAGRVRANPYGRHTRAYAVWALEYTMQWQTLDMHRRDVPGGCQQ